MSSYRDENRPSTLVAYTLGGAPPAAAVDATLRAIGAAASLAGGRVVRQGSSPAEARVVDFREGSRAFAFALELLRMVRRYNELHADAPLEPRIGVHHDTLWFVGEDVIGDAPGVAEHLASLAAPGAVCASATALSRMGSTAAWQLAERGATRAPGTEKDLPILEARPRATALLAESRAAAPGPEPALERAPEPRAAQERAAQEGAVQDRAAQGPEWAQALRGGRPAWANVPLPPRPPSGRTAGQDIVAGLAEIGKAVVGELAERSRGISEEKVREAIRRSTARHAPPGEAYPESPREPAGAALERRKERAARKAGRAVAGFVSHFTSWAVVGGGLLALNLTIAGGYPWSFFPIAGWAIGLICHWQAARSARRRDRELRALEALSAEQLALVDKIQQTEKGMGSHAAAYLAVNGFLAGINLITASGFLWFLFPALGWGIGFLSHMSGALARRRELVRRLQAAGISWADVRRQKRVSGGYHAVSGPTRVTPDMEHYELVQEARSIRDGLLARLSQNAEVGKRMGSEVTELLTTYAEQLEKLVLQNHEFRKALESTPESEIQRDMADYRARIESAEHPTLRREYESALEQGERHLKSLRELGHQKEILGVRIQSAFGLLKQLELDSVRLSSASSFEDVQGLSSIRSRSHELSDYLEGLNEVEGEGKGGGS